MTWQNHFSMKVLQIIQKKLYVVIDLVKARLPVQFLLKKDKE